MKPEETEPIPLARVSQFARQFTHDVRNGLNAIDLQAAYLAEIVEDAEAKEEVQTLRGMVRDSTKMLQTLSKKFQEPSVEVIDCPADVLMESLQGRMSALFPKEAERMTWANEAGDASVQADVESVTEVLSELLRNALHFASGAPSIAVRATAEDGRFLLEVVENEAAAPEADPATWGAWPLVTTRRGGFGLSLFKARASLAAQRGELRQSYHADRRQVVSCLSLPLTPA